jgi:hypothetical protein
MQDFNKICTMLQNVHKHGVMTTNRYPKPSFSIGGAGSHVQSYKKKADIKFALCFILHFVQLPDSDRGASVLYVAYFSICRISNFQNFVKLVSHAALSNAASPLTRLSAGSRDVRFFYVELPIVKN